MELRAVQAMSPVGLRAQVLARRRSTSPACPHTRAGADINDRATRSVQLLSKQMTPYSCEFVRARSTRLVTNESDDRTQVNKPLRPLVSSVPVGRVGRSPISSLGLFLLRR
jgi:hypothetical protein